MSVVTRGHIDRTERKIIFERIQDVEPILENNARLRGQEQHGAFRHLCSIPNVIWEQWLNEEHARGNVGIKPFGPEMDAIARRKLSDPDWAKLRTHGKLCNSYQVPQIKGLQWR